MAFLQYGGAWVATGMSPIPIASVGADPVFIDNFTFNSNFTMLNVGQIQILDYSETGGDDAPGVPGDDFKDDKLTNALKIINLNNAFRESKRLPQAVLAATPATTRATVILETSEIARRRRQKSLLGMLIDQGTVSEDTTEITDENIKSIILAHRAKLVGSFVRPNVVIASVDTYSKMLSYAGKDFTPGINDGIVRDGRIGYWMGMVWVEAANLNGSDDKLVYLDDSNQPKEVSANDVDFIMYDWRFFGGGDRLESARLIESENFMGVKSQVEIVTGARVLKPSAVLVKKTAAG